MIVNVFALKLTTLWNFLFFGICWIARHFSIFLLNRLVLPVINSNHWFDSSTHSRSNQRWARIRTGSDWIRTEANFGWIRTGSDCNFFQNWWIRTGSDWENFCYFNVIILKIQAILLVIRLHRFVWGAVRKNIISDRFSTKTAISAHI